MRKDLRRGLAALVAATAAVALLSGNVAGARPAAQVAAGAPLSAEVIGGTRAPGPDACPRLNGASQIVTPNSCGPPPPPTPKYDCQLIADPPNLRGTTVSAFGAAVCDGSGHLILLVTLEVRPPGGTWREIARARVDTYDYEASTTVSKACVRGSNEYRGVAQATINGDYAGKKESAPRGWSCP
jgi:hypothetical protein